MAFSDVGHSNNTITLSWNSATNRSYGMWKCSNLLSSTWTEVASNMPATAPINQLMLDSETNTAGFFRVDVELP